MTLAHAAAQQSLWLAWNFHPTVVLGVLALGALYAYAIRRRRSDRVPRGQVVAFYAGLGLVALALVSPLDVLGDEYLFSAHMIQHMLVAVAAPPLLLLGLPEWLAAWPLKYPVVRRAAQFLAHPVVAFGLFNGVLWLWHVPALYAAALGNEQVHVFQHLTFLATGVLFWLPIVSPTPLLPRLARPAGVLYLFLGCQPMVVLGALLTFAVLPVYDPYLAAPRLWGLTPLGDQQLGGLIMWLPTNIPYVIALSVLFFQWVGAVDRAEQQDAEPLDELGEPRTVQPASDLG